MDKPLTTKKRQEFAECVNLLVRSKEDVFGKPLAVIRDWINEDEHVEVKDAAEAVDQLESEIADLTYALLGLMDDYSLDAIYRAEEDNHS